MLDYKKIAGFLEQIRKTKPMVHHITNLVTIYDCANIVKIFGGSPVMTFAPEESADMTRLTSALVLNIGTITVEVADIMKLSAQAANEKGIPVILDVCGAGATKFRDEICGELLNTARIDIIKGNISEIARIAGEDVTTKGVDAGEVNLQGADVAKKLARARNCTAVITAKQDIVSNGERVYIVKNGVPLMTAIVGTGCMAASVIGTFAAVEKNYADAAAAGLCCFELAAQVAYETAKVPGGFKSALFDAVYLLNEEKIQRMQRVERSE